ncbi:ABC transporter permease [Hyphomicrobium sp. LHD-15]|uniref:ABC transporter permease n=1 Tax=Hyphomicrobium sp. LHD-15 TaxID=3072142 RepID=UPI00280DF525|nr:ABC transporter permease [Hyphomicrobium sp. LHD-15]MDQ8700184.1 ABC transporter permease [Hyphomicrobium sp. LHD-15]
MSANAARGALSKDRLALGITLAKSMPQFGVATISFFVVMNLLSGGVMPLEGMPKALQVTMQAAPSTQFTACFQSVLFRGSEIVTAAD